MTSTTVRYPVKPKSLTLLELCQTINDLRHAPSRNTAQILTRRLYLHPLTINANAKQQSSKIMNNSVTDTEQRHHINLDKKLLPHRHKVPHGLAILSSSLPLITRTNSKTNTTVPTDESESSTTTISSNRTVPSINRGPPPSSSSSNKRTTLPRPSYITSQPKSSSHYKNRWEKVDVWHQLAISLQKPIPKDPPTTPLDVLTDDYLDNIRESEQQSQQWNYGGIKGIKIFQRTPVCKSIFDENDNDNEDY